MSSSFASHYSSSASQQTKSPGGTSQDRGAGSSATNSVDQNLNYGQGGGGKERSISMVDMYIDNSEPVENVGQIHFSLEYDFQNTTLILKIIQVGTRRTVLRGRQERSAISPARAPA